MDPFWKDIYDGVKDRRYGKLFFSTILIAGASTLFLALLSKNMDPGVWDGLGVFLVPVVLVVAAAVCWRWIRENRRRRQEQLKYDALSRDELAKARSKLKKQMKLPAIKPERRASRRAPVRPPDINLKY